MTLSRRDTLAGLAAFAAASPALAAARPRSVYLLRGFAGLFFSRGMDALGGELQARGVSVWIGSYAAAPLAAALMAADLRAGRSVGVAGHSLGGDAALAIGDGAAFVVSIDPTPGCPPRPRARRVINFHSTLPGLGGGRPAHVDQDIALAIDHVPMASCAQVHRTVLSLALEA